MRGSARKARATEMRWRWPPDNLSAAFADQSLVAVGQVGNKAVRVGGAGGGFHVGIGRIGPGVTDVFGDGSGKQKCLLLHGTRLADAKTFG